MATTYTLIASNTVGSGGASSIDFSSIPNTYTDLKLVYSLRGTGATTSMSALVSFNGATTNRTWKVLYGQGSSAASTSGSDTYFSEPPAASATSNTFGNGELYIPNYAGSSYKSANSDSVGENNATTAYQELFAILWSSTAAINQLTISLASGNLAQYSTAYLYGIKNS